jgi:molybdenum cofactor cytidylyltransferase
MRSRRLTPAELAGLTPGDLVDAVLLASIRLGTRRLGKGTRLDRAMAHELLGAAESGMLEEPPRLGWADAGDLHEDEAAHRLALAVGGAGIDLRPPHLSRVDLAAKWDGVLHVRIAPLAAINAIDPLEVFTLFHAQCVASGEVVASVKVAPHLVPGEVVLEGVRVARADGPVIEVRPYRAQEVPAIVAEDIGEAQLDRFVAGATAKLEALGSRFAGAVQVWEADPARSAARARAALEQLVLRDHRAIVLVAGVSAGDPLSPFREALSALGGSFVRHGVPAHPGSMIWIARLGRSTLLGLPGCGMFSMATAADLVLPRLLTGEVLDATALAELAHGGLLGRQMRFRFPAYARELEAPE